MIALVIVVLVVTLPLVLWATRARRRTVRWQGIDWSRGMPEAAKRVNEGLARHRAGDLVGALASFDAALALEPDDADALLARAATRHRLGRLDEALADYDRAIAAKGATSEALNDRGCLHRDRGDLDRALADVEAAIRLGPCDPVARVSLAEVLAQRGDADGAIASLREAIAIDPTWRAHARTSDALASLRAARPEADVFAP